MFRLLPLLALLAQPVLGAQEAYRIIHPDGTVEFTDEPKPRAERIEIPPVGTYPAPPKPASSAAETRPPPPVQPSITITQPAPGETIWVSDWQVPARVSVTRVPGPGQPQEVELLVDGTPRARGAGPVLLLEPVYRGEHQLVARLVDAQGRELARSQPVTFYVHKHTISR